jgi:hypothetical protein
MEIMVSDGTLNTYETIMEIWTTKTYKIHATTSNNAL